MKRYILLDRDGTIIADKHYLSDPDEVELLPYAAEGLKHLSRLGFGLIVVTNQSGVARGYFNEEQVKKANSRLEELLKKQGVHLDAVYYCPHSPDEKCHCRKPETGMAEQAALDFDFVLKDCYIIGDKDSDVNLAIPLECKSVLVRTGNGIETEKKRKTKPDFVVDNLIEAAKVIEADIETHY
ncbi:MAG: D-glycero-beta-D-manno-heptose 1,7-bisphosphate 7-phosphatase [Alphaproteobacteria bacterium]|nr:D-glycero-beta-D-manno-heptose 1,7-bisphosphate 7-phosphatase [Alphaproteobacteria bacterium]